MREILFRGKRADNGEWVEGFFYEEIGSFIKEKPSSVTTTTHLVIPETVGQFTGLTDKNGKKIFEGDVISAERSAAMSECRRWVQNEECYELRFTKYYDEETVLKFVQDPKDADCYVYVSEELHVEHDYIYAKSIEEAKQQLEDIYRSHLEDEVEYWSDMLEKWEGEE